MSKLIYTLIKILKKYSKINGMYKEPYFKKRRY
jgi:hypothetical protein